jgi:hypothetical protein
MHQHNVYYESATNPTRRASNLFPYWQLKMSDPAVSHVIDTIKACGHSFIVSDHNDRSTLRCVPTA